MTEKNGKFILTQEEHDEASNWLNSWFIRAEFLTKWWCTQHGWSHGRYQMLNMILYTKSVLGYSNYVIWLTVLKRLSLIWMNRSPSSRQLKKYKFFLPAEIYLLAVFMRLASKFRVFPLVLKFRDSFASVYCCSNLYNLRSFLREYLYQ